MMDRYAHGDDGYKYQKDIVADFSTNAWYLGPDPALLEELNSKILMLGTYPETHAESLVQRLVKKHNIIENGVLACNGTSEAIFLIAQLYAGKKSRIISPTFSEYEHACQLNKHVISFCGAGFVSESMQTDFDLFWICNPNNPNGQVIKPQVLASIIKNNPQTIFIIDEAYTDFCLEKISLESYAGQLQNLIILKSLTKNNCLPGLRLGYLLCHPVIGKQLKQHQIPWSVNTLAIEAGKYVLDHPRINYEDLLTYHSLSRHLADALRNLGCEVTPSGTGYFLVKLPIAASELKKRLVMEFGILIRDASNFRTLSPNHIRISSLTAEKNNALIKAIKTCLSACLNHNV